MFDVNVYIHLQSHPHHLSAVDATKMAVAIFCLQQIGAVCGNRLLLSFFTKNHSLSMADNPESSNRNAGNAGNPPNPSAPPDLVRIMTNLAEGQTVMQDTIRQLMKTFHGNAPARSGQQSGQRQTYLLSS